MQKKLLWISSLVVIIGIVVALYVWLPRHEKGVSVTRELPASGKSDELKDIKERAGLLFQKRRYQSLIATLERVLVAVPDNKETRRKLAEAYRGLAETERELGDEAAEEEGEKRARELNPPSPPFSKRGE